MNLMKKIYIVLFAILYIAVAFVSTIHAFEFFGLANKNWMAIILSISFEIGQAAVLFSLLTSPKDRKKIMPWVLMSMFTIVQVLGNVYSSYKYIQTMALDNLKFFKEPIFIWTNLPDDQATVIITYLVGALLPIASLLLTSIVTNQLNIEDINSNELKQYKQQEIETKENLENTFENNKSEFKKEDVLEIETKENLENNKSEFKKEDVLDIENNLEVEENKKEIKNSKVFNI